MGGCRPVGSESRVVEADTSPAASTAEAPIGESLMTEAASSSSGTSADLDLMATRTTPRAQPDAVGMDASPISDRSIDADRAALPLELTRHISTSGNIHPLTSAGGRTLAYWVFGETGPVTLILGGMHGAERTPTLLCAEFVGWLESHPEAVTAGRIVVAPLVDPDGFASRRRNNDNGVDLNRNYPATNWRRRADRHGSRPVSEPETRFVLALMEAYPPSAIVSIHAPLACVNYDGPAEELARQMSHACGLPVRASVGYPTPGSFGSFAGVDKAIPTITLELRPGRDVAPDFDACRKALLVAHEFSLANGR